MRVIVPLDAAVCDSDLLWRVEQMNALTSRDLTTREYGTVEDAAQVLMADHQSVIVVGPHGLDLALDDLRAMPQQHPEWHVVFVVDTTEPGVVDRITAAGYSLVFDSSQSFDAVADEVLRLLPIDRRAVAEEEAEQDALREAGTVEPPPGVKTDLVIVTSAKGGEGVTTVAANLAVALTARGLWRVALVEGDSTFGDLSLLLDLPEQIRYDFDKLRIIDTEAISPLSVVHEESGLQVVRPPADPHLRELPPETAVELVEAVSSMADVVVLDAPLPLVRATGLASAAAAVLLVSSSRTASMKNALLAGRAIHQPDKVHLVINEINRHQETLAIADVERAVGLDVIATLPYDSKVDRSGAGVEPHVLAPARSRFNRAVYELADRLRATSFGSR